MNKTATASIERHIHVPPPVLHAFQALLLQVAKDYNFQVSDITNFSATWTKDKSEYSVTAQFGLLSCDGGISPNMLMAKFKANGTIIPIQALNGRPANYVFYAVNCIRAPF